jgi:hypothetical protein
MPKKRVIKLHITLTALIMSLYGSEYWTLMKEKKENEDGTILFFKILQYTLNVMKISEKPWNKTT